MEGYFLKYDDNMLENFKNVVKENSDCKIYLSGDVARKFLDFSRLGNATINEEKLGKRAKLVAFAFDNGDISYDEIVIKDDLDDREKYQVISLVSKTDGATFTYTYSRNCEKRLVQAREIIIREDKTTEKQREGEF